MKRFMKLGRKALAGALLCSSILCGSVSAAPAVGTEEGMAAFREAISTPAKMDRRVFCEDVLFFAPAIRGNLEIIGQARKHDMRLSGDFDLLVTGDDGDTAKIDVPFYITQTNKSMTVYFKLGDQWRKFQAPTLAATAADVTVTPTPEEVEEQAALVKGVTLLRETPTQRTMLVTMDSNKLADLVRKYSDQNPADKGTANDGNLQKTLMDYLDQGLRKADIWYTWTIDKKDWQTITMSYHLSSIIQETARAALNNLNPEWPPEVKNILETLSYYSELKTYTTFLNPDAETKADVPDEVWRNAVEVKDMITTENEK